MPAARAAANSLTVGSSAFQAYSPQDRMVPVDLADRSGAALVDLLVKVDREHRRIAPDADLPPIRRVDFQDLLVDHVLPAMVLEITCHARLLFHGSRRHSIRTLREAS